MPKCKGKYTVKGVFYPLRKIQNQFVTFYLPNYLEKKGFSTRVIYKSHRLLGYYQHVYLMGLE